MFALANNRSIIWKIAVGAVATIAMFGFYAFAANAAESPAGCDSSNIQQTPQKAPSGLVYDGSLITYTVTYSNVDPDGVGGVQPCDVTGANAVINLPGGGVINVLTNVNFPVGTTIVCPGGPGCAAGPYTYNVIHAHEVSSVITTNFQISGTLQDAIPLPASDTDNLASGVIHPSTITTITASSTMVVLGGSVNIMITEQNDGDVPLTIPSVATNLPTAVYGAPPTSGDNGNGILDPGETWSWSTTSGPINADTIFTATGRGLDPNNQNVTWCPDPQTPGQGTICDQDEQDSVTIEVVSPLVVSKTANTSFNREWNWNIVKIVDDSELELAEGESFTVNYDVDVTASSEDVDHVATGTISIMNPADNPSATISGISDVLDVSGAAVVDCTSDATPTVFPIVLAPGEALNCTYSQTSASPNDSLNTVTVSTTGDVPGDDATAAVVWGGPANVIDECVNVSDNQPWIGGLGQVCASQAPAHFDYTTTFGPDTNQDADVVTECNDDFNHINVASLVTNDTQTPDSDDATVHVVVNCETGCTLTQGYWKTHNESFHGGAPTDDGWLEIGVLGEDTLFFDSGKTWFEIFWTAPKGGNVYIQLAHQYMAAKLNILNGATPPAAVSTAITGAEGFFPGKTPATSLTNSQKNQAKGWASTLGSFNEGLIGPGHCSEQNPA